MLLYSKNMNRGTICFTYIMFQNRENQSVKEIQLQIVVITHIKQKCQDIFQVVPTKSCVEIKTFPDKISLSRHSNYL